MPALPAPKVATVLEALRTHRNTRRVAKLTGVGQTTVWRLAKKHGIALISRSEHFKARRREPEFIARHLRAVRGPAARHRMQAQQADPRFRKISIDAARRNMTRLNSDPAFRKASSERLTKLHADPDYRAKLYGALSAAHRLKRKTRRDKAVRAALRTLMLFDTDSDFCGAARERLNHLQESASGKGKGATRP